MDKIKENKWIIAGIAGITIAAGAMYLFKIIKFIYLKLFIIISKINKLNFKEEKKYYQKKFNYIY